MLRDEIARYTELSGNDGEHTSIGIIGAYLDGYEKGLESRKNKGEWIPKYSITDEWDVDLVCSKCGYVGIEGYAHGYELNEIDMQEARNYTKKLDMNFCTCCGADMRGVSE